MAIARRFVVEGQLREGSASCSRIASSNRGSEDVGEPLAHGDHQRNQLRFAPRLGLGLDRRDAPARGDWESPSCSTNRAYDPLNV
ncbi:MAG TPA: hypothetical protein VNT81_07005, partial [Vicinamibacterales bacterium]|nr:hypothetical protein [Vicinamibacterales bacterium]